MKNREKNRVRKHNRVGKYIRNIMLLMCVAMLAGILMPGVRAEAASKKAKAVKAYKEYLGQSVIYPWEDSSMGWKTSDCKFALAYVDSDVVPELVVFNFRSGSFNGYYTLLTYKEGKVSVVATPTQLGISFGYYKKKGILMGGHYYTHPQGGPGSSNTYYKLKKGEIASELMKGVYEPDEYYKRTKKEYHYSFSPAGEWGDTKNITKTQFNKKLKKFVGSTKMTEDSSMKFYKNTAANRKRYLK